MSDEERLARRMAPSYERVPFEVSGWRPRWGEDGLLADAKDVVSLVVHQSMVTASRAFSPNDWSLSRSLTQIVAENGAVQLRAPPGAVFVVVAGSLPFADRDRASADGWHGVAVPAFTTDCKDGLHLGMKPRSRAKLAGDGMVLMLSERYLPEEETAFACIDAAAGAVSRSRRPATFDRHAGATWLWVEARRS